MVLPMNKILLVFAVWFSGSTNGVVTTSVSESIISLKNFVFKKAALPVVIEVVPESRSGIT